MKVLCFTAAGPQSVSGVQVAPQTHIDLPLDQLDLLRLPPASLTVISMHLG